MKNSVKMSEKLKNGYENSYIFQNLFIHLQLFSYSFLRQGRYQNTLGYTLPFLHDIIVYFYLPKKEKRS